MSWKKNNNLGRNNKETNKTMTREELLEKSKQDNWTHWHQRIKRPLKTLTYDFQKLESSFKAKDARKL